MLCIIENDSEYVMEKTFFIFQTEEQGSKRNILTPLPHTERTIDNKNIV